VKATVGFLLGLAAAGVLHHLLRPVLAAPVFERENFRGRRIPATAGLVIVLSVLCVVGGWMVVHVLWDANRLLLIESLQSATLATLGFGFLGLLDDLAGSAGPRGFRGHVQALSRGELTTGLVKLVGGGLVAIVTIAPWVGESFRQLLSGALVIALAANLGNLLDRAPGRVGKASLIAFAALALTSRMAVALTGPAVVAGAGAALLVPDVRERCMLGDTGANVLGAGVGLGLVLTTTGGTWEAAAVVLLALNGVSEWVSFSRVIDRVGPLRWLDRLGAPPR
jgi:hypothetical protein